MNLFDSIAWWASVAAVLAAAAIDIGSRRIPNWLTVPFLVSGIAAQAVANGFSGVGRSFAGIAIACLIIGLPCWLGAMGLGDLKLAAGVGAWVGPGQMVFAMVMTAIAGGILAAGYALWHGQLGSSLEKAGDLVTRGSGSKRSSAGAALSIPYAPAIAAGTLISFFAR